jgi:hypothetical protein
MLQRGLSDCGGPLGDALAPRYDYQAIRKECRGKNDLDRANRRERAEVRHLLGAVMKAKKGAKNERPPLLDGTHPTSAVLPDAGYFANLVTLSLALRSSGDAGRGVGRIGAAAALVAG